MVEILRKRKARERSGEVIDRVVETRGVKREGLEGGRERGKGLAETPSHGEMEEREWERVDGQVEVGMFVESEMNKIGRERIYRVVKMFSKSEMNERGREVFHVLVKCGPKSEKNERTRERGYRMVKSDSKSEMKERGGERIHRLVENVAKIEVEERGGERID